MFVRSSRWRTFLPPNQLDSLFWVPSGHSPTLFEIWLIFWWEKKILQIGSLNICVSLLTTEFGKKDGWHRGAKRFVGSQLTSLLIFSPSEDRNRPKFGCFINLRQTSSLYFYFLKAGWAEGFYFFKSWRWPSKNKSKGLIRATPTDQACCGL